MCGDETGWLCDRCKEDRMDARFAALALAILKEADDATK